MSIRSVDDIRSVDEVISGSPRTPIRDRTVSVSSCPSYFSEPEEDLLGSGVILPEPTPPLWWMSVRYRMYGMCRLGSVIV